MENNDEQNDALHELNQINQDVVKTQVLAVMVEGTLMNILRVLIYGYLLYQELLFLSKS